MLNNALENIRMEKAIFARDVEYVKEIALDDIIDTCTESAESMFERETMDELVEAAAMVDRLPSEEDITEEAVEISRILDAEDDISFEEMIGICY